jgi:MFS family permease
MVGLGAFWILAVTAGLAFYNVLVYLDALIDDAGIAVEAASAATAVFWVSYGLAGVPIGRFIGRRDVRLVMVPGAALAGAALFLLGRVDTTAELVAVYVLFGTGFAASSLVPATTVVSQWFDEGRAAALAVTTTGLSVGGLLITPFSAAWIERDGLEAVTPWLGLGYFCAVAPLALGLMRSRLDTATGVEAAAGSPITADPPAEVFRWIAFGSGLIFVAQLGGLTHLYRLADGRFDSHVAAATVSAAAFGSVAGRLLGIGVLRYVTPLQFIMGLCAIQSVSLAGLSLSTTSAAMLVSAAVLGATVGNVIVLLPTVIIARYGIRRYADVFARSQLWATLGIATGPVLVGVLVVETDGYRLPYSLLAVFSLAALGGFSRLLRTEPSDLPPAAGSLG